MKLLPGWSDEAIVECDLVRLHIAIAAAREQIEADWRQRARLAGVKVEEPQVGAQDNRTFNDQLRAVVERFRNSSK